VTNLKEMRLMADWTQAKTSRASGINRAKLSQAECGEIDLTGEEDATIRRVLVRAIRERAARMTEVLADSPHQESVIGQP
jgi:transcriptional regulator with XRE-family HTH domain